MASLVVIPLALLAASLVDAAPVNAPTTLPSYNGWTSVGCFVDSVHSRQLPQAAATEGGTAAMTVERCLDACRADGHRYAGLEYSQECYCGDAIPPEVATDDRCNMPCNGDASEICGGPNGLTVYHDDTVPTGPTTVDHYKNWSSLGCYEDSVHARVLPDSQFPSGALTVEKCLDACDAAGYEYGGVEYGSECYCGRSAPTTLATDGRCNMSCAGNSQETCGGPNGINVYKTCSPSNAPQSPPWYNGWDFSGCYVDSVDNRVLPLRTAIDQDATMTVEKCLVACGQLGYYYAGLEYAQECYCGTGLPPQIATDGRCNMVCNGDSLELCGGPNGIDVYHWTNSPNPGTGNQGGSCPVTTTFTTETIVPTTITSTTTIVETTSGSTTVAVPITYTTSVAVPITASTTVAVPLTASTTVIVPVTETTTLFPISTFVASTTAPQIIPTTAPLTVGRTSFTLSIFTGTTSFVDAFTTVVQPVIILTTLARTYTTTTGFPTTISTSTVVAVPTSTTLVIPTPFTATSSEIDLVPTTSFDIEPVTTTSFDVEPATTTSFDIEPAVGTYVTTFTTTITTSVPSPLTVTTTITGPLPTTTTTSPP